MLWRDAYKLAMFVIFYIIIHVHRGHRDALRFGWIRSTINEYNEREREEKEWQSTFCQLSYVSCNISLH